MRQQGDIELIARGLHVQENKVLLCRSAGAAHTYLPGGHVEFAEQARAALAREMREELGLDAEAGPFLGGVEHAFLQRGRLHAEVNLVFLLKVRGLDAARPPQALEQGIEFEWGEVSHLGAASLEPRVLRELVPEWLHGTGTGRRWATSGDAWT